MTIEGLKKGVNELEMRISAVRKREVELIHIHRNVSKLDEGSIRCSGGVSPDDVNAFCVPLVATAKSGHASQI